jgi:hypothetical protein
MSVCGMSSLSALIGFLMFLGSLKMHGQQKANDFTKRVGSFDGKMSTLNGRSSKFNRMNSHSSRRISIEEWPAHFSSFGGKRFPMRNVNLWGGERVPSTRIEIKTPLNDQIADESSERATNQNLSKKAPAANAVEFRDAYYARLNDRVDDWMNKVNNMSLRDINRYQFRRDRPSRPGFPVQKAGGGAYEGSDLEATLKGSGLSENEQISLPQGSKDYWMGPRKVKSSSASSTSNDGSQKKTFSNSIKSNESTKNFKTKAKPILGPKTIRVQVGNSE